MTTRKCAYELSVGDRVRHDGNVRTVQDTFFWGDTQVRIKFRDQEPPPVILVERIDTFEVEEDS